MQGRATGRRGDASHGLLHLSCLRPERKLPGLLDRPISAQENINPLSLCQTVSNKERRGGGEHFVGAVSGNRTPGDTEDPELAAREG